MLIKNVFAIFLPLVFSLDQVVIRLRPEQILNTFHSVISSDYLQTLANAFAKKAAEHLISKMKSQEKQLAFDHRTLGEKTSLDPKLVSEQQVLTLLSEPLPDGDNLEAEMTLSEEEGTKTTKDSKVRGPMKINGAYFKRHFS